MKTAYTFKIWYWGEDHEKQPPHWWKNFLKEYSPSGEAAFKDLSKIAKVIPATNGSIHVEFNSPEDLTFFVLRWS